MTDRLHPISGEDSGLKQRGAGLDEGINERGGIAGAEPRSESGFEQALLPTDAAYNLARWLTRDDHDAEDLVTAYCGPLKSFGGFRARTPTLAADDRPRPVTWLEQKRARPATAFDEEIHGVELDVWPRRSR